MRLSLLSTTIPLLLFTGIAAAGPMLSNNDALSLRSEGSIAARMAPPSATHESHDEDFGEYQSNTGASAEEQEREKKEQEEREKEEKERFDALNEAIEKNQNN